MRKNGLPLALAVALTTALTTVLTTALSTVAPSAGAADPAYPHIPIGVLEEVASPAPGKMRITGWATDADSPLAALLIGVSIDSVFIDPGWRADVSRPDLGLAPEYGDRHGYVIDLDAEPGWRWVCTWANNVPDASEPAHVRCQYAWVQPPAPDTRIIGSERSGDMQTFLVEAVDPPVKPAINLQTAPPVPTSTLECSWDGGPWSACTSPATATVASGPHSFAARAVNSSGVPDATPATQAFTIPIVQGPPLTDSALVLGVKAVKRKSKLKVSVRPRSSEKNYVFTVQKKRKKKWKKVTRVRTSGPRDTKVLNLKRGRYRVVIKSQHGLVGTISQTVRLKR